MDQKPIRGRESLEAPTPEIARLYLDEARTAGERSADRIDRRGVLLQDIVAQVTLAVLVTAYLLVAREKGAAAIQPLVFFVLVAGQIATGAGERGGMRWKDPRDRPMRVVALILFGAAMLGAIVLLLVAPRAVPIGVYAIPGLILIVGLAVPAARGLLRAPKRPGAAEPTRATLPTATRVATMCLGLQLGFTAVAVGMPESGPTAFLSVVIVLIFAAWLFAWRTEGGPATMGLWWGSAQHAVLLGSAVLVGGLGVAAAYTDAVGPWTAVAGGAATLIAYVLVSFLPGRAPVRLAP